MILPKDMFLKAYITFDKQNASKDSEQFVEAFQCTVDVIVKVLMMLPVPPDLNIYNTLQY